MSYRLEHTDGSTKVKMTKVPFRIAFALRRIILADIPNVSIPFVRTGSDSGFVIKFNDGVISPDQLRHRMALVPVRMPVKLMGSTNVNKWSIRLDVERSPSDPMFREVNTNDIKIYYDEEDVTDKHHKQFFPVDPVTKGAIIITYMSPKGKRIKFTAGLAVGTAGLGAWWSVAHRVVFAHDRTGERVDGAIGKTSLDIETHSGYTNVDIFHKAVEVLDRKLENMDMTVVDDSDTVDPTHRSVMLQGEGHTMATLISHYMSEHINSSDSSVIKAVGASITHSEEKRVRFRVWLKPGQPDDKTILGEFKQAASGIRQILRSVTPTIPLPSLTVDDSVPDPVQLDGFGLAQEGIIELECLRATHYYGVLDKVKQLLENHLSYHESPHKINVDQKYDKTFHRDLLTRVLFTLVRFRTKTSMDPLFVNAGAGRATEAVTTEVTSMVTTQLDRKGEGSLSLAVEKRRELPGILSTITLGILEAIARAAKQVSTGKKKLLQTDGVPIIEPHPDGGLLITYAPVSKNILQGIYDPVVGLMRGGELSIRYFSDPSLLENTRTRSYAIASYLRYKYINVSTQSLEIDLSPEHKKIPHKSIDMFSTPFNSNSLYFCSAYPDVDGPLGALGEYHDIVKRERSGERVIPLAVETIHINPVFVENLITPVIEEAILLAKAWVKADRPFNIHFVLPDWTDVSGYKLFYTPSKTRGLKIVTVTDKTSRFSNRFDNFKNIDIQTAILKAHISKS